MANTFKSKTFTGASTAANTSMTVYTVPASTTAIVVSLNLANISNAMISVNVQVDKVSANDVYIAKSVPIPTGGSLELMTGNKYVLETGDVLKVTSTVANSLDSMLSIMEQS
jgi:hypothetical protein